MKITKVLIGIDDSKYADHATEYGFSLARQFNAVVGVVNIVEPAIVPQMTTGNDTLMGMNTQGLGIEELELMDMQKTQSDNIIDRTLAKYAGEINVTHFSDYGPTADGIVQCSKEFGADIIVIGTHSRTGLSRLLMGSVAEDVMRHSEVPVLVVPFKEEEVNG